MRIVPQSSNNRNCIRALDRLISIAAVGHNESGHGICPLCLKSHGTKEVENRIILWASAMSNIDDVARQEQRQILMRLENEHAALDKQVAEFADSSGADQMQLSRLKRRKLKLKDSIVKLKSNVLPDLPA